jgi:hypothetical protein
MGPQQILDDYNYYRAYTARVQEVKARGGYVGQGEMQTKKGEDRAPYFERMLSFCGEHNLDPKVWLYLLFKIRKWQAAPRFHQLVTPLFQKKQEAQRSMEMVESGASWDVNRDIGFSTEALKRRYLNAGDADRCLNEMAERTFGFHPKSLVCARCPIAQRCKQQVETQYGAHMISLRRGEITTQQAQQLARCHGR